MSNDITAGLIGAIQVQRTFDALSMKLIKVRVLINNKLYEDTGQLKYGEYAVFPSLERAYRIKKTTLCGKDTMFLVDDSVLQYDPWEIYTLLNTKVVKEPTLDMRTLLIQFLLGSVIGAFGGVAIGTIGLLNTVLLGGTYWILRTINRGFGYARV